MSSTPTYTNDKLLEQMRAKAIERECDDDTAKGMMTSKSECDVTVQEMTKSESNEKLKVIMTFDQHRAQWWIGNPGPDETKEERYRAAEDEYNKKYYEEHRAECEQWVADMEKESKMYRRYYYI